MKQTKTILTMALLCAMLTGCAAAQNAPESEVSSAEVAESDSNNRFAAYDFSNVSEEIVYNENAECANNPVPSAYEHAETRPITSTYGLVSGSTDIVIVRIKDVPDEDSKPLTGDEELDREIAAKIQSDNFPRTTILLYPAEVLYKVEGGFEQGDDIVIMQAEGNWGVTFETDKEYLVLLEDMKNGTYKPAHGFDNVFEINDDFTVQPESCFTISARYEGMSVADFVSDLKSGWQEVQENPPISLTELKEQRKQEEQSE